jgi:hypothetical protein
MPISTVSQKGLDAPLSLTTPNLGSHLYIIWYIYGLIGEINESFCKSS